MKKNNSRDSIALLELAHSVDGSNTKAMVLLARLYASNRHRESAIAMSRKIIKNSSDLEELEEANLLISRLSSTENEIRPVREILPQTRREDKLFSKVFQAQSDSALCKTDSLDEFAILINSFANQLLFIALAYSLLFERKYVDAVDVLTNLINSKISLLNSLLARGIAFIFLKNYPKVRVNIRSYAFLCLFLDNIYFQQAYIDLSDCIKIDGSWCKPFQIRGQLRAIQGVIGSAIRDISKSIELGVFLSKDHRLYYQRAVLYHQLGEFMEAKLDLVRAFEIEPNDTKTLYLLGVSYVKLCQYDDVNIMLVPFL